MKHFFILNITALLQVILLVTANSQCITCINTNTFAGITSGSNLITTSTIDNAIDNSFFGRTAGVNVRRGDRNCLFGKDAGVDIRNEQDNSIFGAYAGLKNTADKNSFYGAYSGTNNTNGTSNSFFGYESGSQNTEGGSNSFFGHGSGKSKTTGSGNTYVGSEAAGNLQIGSNNTIIGFKAGNDFLGGDNNILIGAGAGDIAFAYNDKLYIHNSTSDTPLIYGDFSNQEMIVNGTLEVTGGTAAVSSRASKQGFFDLDESDVLSKISQMNIQEWSYINHPDQRHVGPVAEDFHAAFGLGKDDKTITTTDMSGVALVAIQALEKENNTLKESLKEMTYLINKMNDRLQKLEEK